MKKNEEKLNAYQEHEIENKGDYKVRESRLSNLLTFLVSLIIAFGIWMYAIAMESPNASATFTAVPVTVIRNTELSMSVISGYDYTVDVTVGGKQSDINRLKTDQIEAVIDASDIKGAGRYTLDVDVTVPGNVSVTNQSITTASVYIDNNSSVSVPVTVKLTNYMLDNGYELGDPVTNITEVKVEGPSAVLDRIAEAQTVLELGHITASLTTSSSLRLVDAAGDIITNPYLKIGADEVEVTVPLYTSKDVPIEVDSKYGYWNSSNVKLTISPESIRIKGEPSLLNNITRIKLSALDEKKTVTDSITQSITLPDGIINTFGIENATIQIEHIGTATKELTVEEFKVINPDGLKYELLDNFITVKLRGPNADLPYIGASNITATIDLTSFKNTSGTSSVPVTITVGGLYGSKTYEVGEYKVSVTIGQ